ncbi:unnamed protein product [Calypogeia fissa]
MAVTIGHRYPSCRIGASCSNCGIRQALAQMQVNPTCWVPSMYSRNAGTALKWGTPAGHIFLTSLSMESFERGTVVAVYSVKRTQPIASPNLNLSTCLRSSGRVSRGESPINSFSSQGGDIAVHASKTGGEIEGEAHRETRDEARIISPAGGKKLGRRAAMLLGGSTLWSGLGCCRICKEAAAAEDLDWDYGGPCGPSNWTGMCRSGAKQSPVDIPSSNTKDGGSLGVLNFVYSPSAVSVKNTGHGTIQVNFGKANNFLRVRGQTLRLLQFHFHAPSEHAFDGLRYPMEAHLVHRDPISGNIAVVGVMLDASKNAVPNKCLSASLAFVPEEHGLSVDAPIMVSPSLLLPPIRKDGSRGYVHYGGSLTTPPCSEGVEWFVLDTPVKISSSQIVDFMRFSGDGHSLAFNSRPLQPLGERTIFKGP